MTNKDRTEFFQLIRLKLDEIEDIMEAYGGREQFLSLWCFGAFVPETEESPDRYEMMTGMHIAMEDEFDQCQALSMNVLKNIDKTQMTNQTLGQLITG